MISPVWGTGSVIGIGALKDTFVGVAEGLGVGVAVAVGIGVGLTIETPLFHSNFFPDLTQVNFIPATTEVAPAFVQGAPAFALAAPACGSARIVTRRINEVNDETLRIKIYLSVDLSPQGEALKLRKYGRKWLQNEFNTHRIVKNG